MEWSFQLITSITPANISIMVRRFIYLQLLYYMACGTKVRERARWPHFSRLRLCYLIGEAEITRYAIILLQDKSFKWFYNNRVTKTCLDTQIKKSTPSFEKNTRRFFNLIFLSYFEFFSDHSQLL